MADLRIYLTPYPARDSIVVRDISDPNTPVRSPLGEHWGCENGKFSIIPTWEHGGVIRCNGCGVRVPTPAIHPSTYADIILAFRKENEAPKKLDPKQYPSDG